MGTQMRVRVRASVRKFHGLLRSKNLNRQNTKKPRGNHAAQILKTQWRFSMQTPGLDPGSSDYKADLLSITPCWHIHVNSGAKFCAFLRQIFVFEGRLLIFVFFRENLTRLNFLFDSVLVDGCAET